MFGTYVVIIIGSAIGGAARFSTAQVVALFFGGAFPLGTIVANTLGSFIVGLVAALAFGDGRWQISPLMRDFLIIGFCGGYTTFSAFSLQTMEMIRSGEWAAAAVNVGVSLLLCLIATWLGLLLGAALQR